MSLNPSDRKDRFVVKYNKRYSLRISSKIIYINILYYTVLSALLAFLVIISFRILFQYMEYFAQTIIITNNYIISIVTIIMCKYIITIIKIFRTSQQLCAAIMVLRSRNVCAHILLSYRTLGYYSKRGWYNGLHEKLKKLSKAVVTALFQIKGLTKQRT